MATEKSSSQESDAVIAAFLEEAMREFADEDLVRLTSCGRPGAEKASRIYAAALNELAYREHLRFGYIREQTTALVAGLCKALGREKGIPATEDIGTAVENLALVLLRLPGHELSGRTMYNVEWEQGVRVASARKTKHKRPTMYKVRP